VTHCQLVAEICYTCGVWAYESKKPGRSSTSSLQSISMWDTRVFKFRFVANFRCPPVSRSEPRGREVTITVARRDRGPPRGRAVGP